jgi:2-polyprenyl-3-methyl-5-hydroxy-6-metoxy-1,4-benzoquinol methylase
VGIALRRTASRLTVHKSVPAVRIHLAPPTSPGSQESPIQQARADGAARVLDIGCGWGALQKRLVKEHGESRGRIDSQREPG